mmetsp:Transcript_68762/g.199488  ORF Transcript_68762/g.199488 Transcript_68762/m.199488 type:complete len:221 (+) Transcript_68762:258-920(+)
MVWATIVFRGAAVNLRHAVAAHGRHTEQAHQTHEGQLYALVDGLLRSPPARLRLAGRRRRHRGRSSPHGHMRRWLQDTVVPPGEVAPVANGGGVEPLALRDGCEVSKFPDADEVRSADNLLHLHAEELHRYQIAKPIAQLDVDGARNRLLCQTGRRRCSAPLERFSVGLRRHQVLQAHPLQVFPRQHHQRGKPGRLVRDPEIFVERNHHIADQIQQIPKT